MKSQGCLWLFNFPAYLNYLSAITVFQVLKNRPKFLPDTYFLILSANFQAPKILSILSFLFCIQLTYFQNLVITPSATLFKFPKILRTFINGWRSTFLLPRFHSIYNLSKISINCVISSLICIQAHSTAFIIFVAVLPPIVHARTYFSNFELFLS